MNWIDSHTHIYLPEFSEDIDDVMQRARQAGVQALLLPNIDSSSAGPMLDLCKRFPAECFPMMALHPGSVKENYRTELDFAAARLKETAYCAIGETGIDLYWDTTFRNQQVDCFEQHLQWAAEYSLPLVIHSRNSFDLVMDILQAWKGKTLKGVFHCFTGNREQAAAVLNMGFLLGIGGILTYKNSGLDEVVRYTGLNPVMIETDAPYLTPVPFRGKRNEPAYLPYVAKKMAALLELSEEYVANQLLINTKQFFVLEL